MNATKEFSRNNSQEKDYLWLHIKDLPYFRALVRAVEARFYQDIHFSEPLLDMGCGDGHFASTIFEHPVDYGIDPGFPPLREALNRGAYKSLVQATGSELPFPDGYFGSAFSNSVLEHIPQIDPVLKEIGRVLKPGASFIFCVPNDQFDPNLSIAIFLEKFGFKKLGRLYRNFFDRITRHHHLDPPDVWEYRLRISGFLVEDWWNYFSIPALHTVELGHFFGFPSLMSHLITHRWILVPRKWNLIIPYLLTRKYYNQSPRSESGVCTFFVARKN